MYVEVSKTGDYIPFATFETLQLKPYGVLFSISDLLRYYVPRDLSLIVMEVVVLVMFLVLFVRELRQVQYFGRENFNFSDNC
jgi:hypothetical protein